MALIHYGRSDRDWRTITIINSLGHQIVLMPQQHPETLRVADVGGRFAHQFKIGELTSDERVVQSEVDNACKEVLSGETFRLDYHFVSFLTKLGRKDDASAYLVRLVARGYFGVSEAMKSRVDAAIDKENRAAVLAVLQARYAIIPMALSPDKLLREMYRDAMEDYRLLGVVADYIEDKKQTKYVADIRRLVSLLSSA